MYLGTIGLKRVPHIRRVARPVRIVRVQESAGNQKQNAGRNSDVVQTRIVQINKYVAPSPNEQSQTHVAIK